MTRLPRGAALALAVGWALAPAAVRAEKPNVLVLPYQALNKGISPELAEQTTVVVAQEMSAMGLEVARAEDVASADAPGKAPAKEGGKNAPSGDPLAGEKAQELIAAAKQNMEDSDLPPAIDALKKAVKLLADNGDAVPDLRLLSEAYLQLGVAHFRDSDEDAADEALTQAVHYAPTRELDETEYPPIFIRVFQRVRFNVLRRPRATIEVRAPAGAQLLFDGRNLGTTPANLVEALPGNHWIRVEKAGEPVQVKKVMVRSKRTILVEFDGAGAAEPEPEAAVGVLGAVSKNRVEAAHLEQLRAAGKRAGAEYVMIGAIYKTDTAYNIYTSLISVADGSAGRAAEIAFDLDMLSAQIEVFKLAEDVKGQVKSGKLSQPVSEASLVLAPKIDLRPAKKKVVASRETKVGTYVAAPPAIPAPKEITIAAVPEGRAPVASPAGAAIAASVVKPAPTAVPKDEEGAVSNAALIGPTTAVIPADELDEDDEGQAWWVWVLLGVAVAGGAGAGGYLLLSNSSPSEGTLRIQW